MKLYVALILLIILFSTFQVSFSQGKPSQQVFEENSPQIITRDGKIPIKISTISDPGTNKTFVIRVVSPEGLSYKSNMNLQSDSLGFATRTLYYPDDFYGATTYQYGNYSIYIQDGETRNLIKSSSFEVSFATPETSDFWSKTLVPIIVVPVTAGLITFMYNYLSKKRDEEKAKQQKERDDTMSQKQKERDREKYLQEKKSDYFISLSPVYWHVVGNAASLIPSLCPSETQQQMSNTVSTGTQKAKEDPKKKYENNLKSFYFLICYMKARTELFEKIGSYFLDDPEAEKLLSKISTAIAIKLRDILGPLNMGKLQKLVPEKGNIADLESSIKSEEGKNLFKEFEEKWLKDNRIDDLVLLMKLYNVVFRAEINRFFKDWYSDHEKIEKMINEDKAEAEELTRKVEEKKLLP